MVNSEIVYILFAKTQIFVCLSAVTAVLYMCANLSFAAINNSGAKFPPLGLRWATALKTLSNMDGHRYFLQYLTGKLPIPLSFSFFEIEIDSSGILFVVFVANELESSDHLTG